MTFRLQRLQEAATQYQHSFVIDEHSYTNITRKFKTRQTLNSNAPDLSILIKLIRFINQ